VASGLLGRRLPYLVSDPKSYPSPPLPLRDNALTSRDRVENATNGVHPACTKSPLAGRYPFRTKNSVGRPTLTLGFPYAVDHLEATNPVAVTACVGAPPPPFPLPLCRTRPPLLSGAPHCSEPCSAGCPSAEAKQDSAPVAARKKASVKQGPSGPRTRTTPRAHALLARPPSAMASPRASSSSPFSPSLLVRAPFTSAHPQDRGRRRGPSLSRLAARQSSSKG